MSTEAVGPEPQSLDPETTTVCHQSHRQVAWSGRCLQPTLRSIPVGEVLVREAHPETDQR